MIKEDVFNINEVLGRLACFLLNQGVTSAIIGIKLKYAREFLDATEGVISKKAYKKYISENAISVGGYPMRKQAALDLLHIQGIGYQRVEKKIKTLEKLSNISAKNEVLINSFFDFLNRDGDLSMHTIRSYSDIMKRFYTYSNDFSLEVVKRYIATLEERKLKPRTIQIHISALEKYSQFLKKPIRIKRPKIPRTLNLENVPTEREYNKLLECLKEAGNMRGYFFVKILGTTGARVSEFMQFKWEDILNGEVMLKGKGGKYRHFFFQRQLIEEAREAKLTEGHVAMGRYGDVISTRGIASYLKSFSKYNIDKAKLHPHAFRHFFAKQFLKKSNNVTHLADLLGHGSIDTTRIYLTRTHNEQKRDFNKSVTW